MLIGLFAGSIAAIVAVLVSLPLHSPLANAFNSLTVALASLIVGLAAGFFWNRLGENSQRVKYFAAGMAVFFVVVAVVIVIVGDLAFPRLLGFGLPLAVIVFVLVGVFVPLYQRLPTRSAHWYTAALLIAALGMGFGLVTQSDAESGDLALPEPAPRPAASAPPATPAAAESPTPAPTHVAAQVPTEEAQAAVPDPTSVPEAAAASPTDQPAASPPTSVPAPPPTEAAVSTEPAPAVEQTTDAQYLVGEGSEITFTVGEQLTRIPLPIEAVMRSEELSGHINVDGRPSSIQVNLHSLASDEQYRDRYVRSRMFPDHPVATLTVEGVGDLPEQFAGGEEFQHRVDGTLNLNGVDHPMSFDLEVRNDGDVLYILGRTVFSWQQLGIPVPTARSVVWVEDDVDVQVLLEARVP